MNQDRACPRDVLREFINDLKSAFGTGAGDELDRTELASQWPDLLVSYDHALACLKDLSKSVETEDDGRWQCKGCGRTLSTTDWTYADLADRGIPICGHCDRDMQLVPSLRDSEIPAASPNTRRKP